MSVTSYLWSSNSGSWQTAHSAVLTDDQGRYDINNTDQGTYRVDFTPAADSPFAQQAWSSAESIDVADDVMVAYGADVDGVNAVLGDGARLSGQVTGPGGEPLAGIQVVADRQGAGTYYERTTTTGADGRYDLGGLAGVQHSVAFVDPGNAFATRWSTTPVLTRGQMTTLDAQLAERATITGTVTKSDGTPFDAGCTVTAYGYYYGQTYQATVAADGTYVLGPVTPDYYQVRFDPAAPYEPEWWNDWHGDRWSASWVYMWSGDPVGGIDAQLERLATVSGTVTDAAGAPVAGAGVAAYQDEGEWVHVADATTDEAGHYSLLGLRAGSIKVHFRNAGALRGEWWDDKDTLAQADPIDVGTGSDTTGIDAVLAAPSSASGNVTDKAGTPLEGLSVAAWQQEDTGWRLVADASTDAFGQYRIDGLHRGAARIHFFGRSFVGEWYDDKASRGAADDVAIPAASAVDGIDAALALPSSVSGTVSTDAGLPAADVRVQAYQDQGDRWVSVGDVSADALGKYRIDGLRTGDVRLHFVGPDIVGEWWHDKTTFSTADRVPVPEETDVTGIDAVIQSYGRISGRVSDTAGSPLRAWVGLYRWNGMWWRWAGSAYAGWDGSYSFRHLAPGEYATYYYS